MFILSLIVAWYSACELHHESANFEQFSDMCPHFQHFKQTICGQIKFLCLYSLHNVHGIGTFSGDLAYMLLTSSLSLHISNLMHFSSIPLSLSSVQFYHIQIVLIVPFLANNLFFSNTLHIISYFKHIFIVRP